MIRSSNEPIEAQMMLTEAAKMILKRGKWKEENGQEEVLFSKEDLEGGP